MFHSAKRRVLLLTFVTAAALGVAACDSQGNAAASGGSLVLKLVKLRESGMVSKLCHPVFEVMNNTKARLNELTLTMQVEGYDPRGGALFDDQPPGVIRATFLNAGAGNPRESETGAEEDVRIAFRGTCENLGKISIRDIRTCDLEDVDGNACRSMVQLKDWRED